MYTNIYSFEVTGGFNVNEALAPVESAMGTVIGFQLPDGRTVKLVVALEIEEDDGKSYDYVTSEKEMAELGFEALDYDKLNFYKVDN